MSSARFALIAPVPVEVPDGVLCGVYFLLDGEEVVYVGQSVNVYARVANHRESKRFATAICIPVPRDELDAVESAFIRRLRPRLNKSGLSEGPWPGDDSLLAPYTTGTPSDAALRRWLARMSVAFKQIGDAYTKDVRKIRQLSKDLVTLRARGLSVEQD